MNLSLKEMQIYACTVKCAAQTNCSAVLPFSFKESSRLQQ